MFVVINLNSQLVYAPDFIEIIVSIEYKNKRIFMNIVLSGCLFSDTHCISLYAYSDIQCVWQVSPEPIKWAAAALIFCGILNEIISRCHHRQFL